MRPMKPWMRVIIIAGFVVYLYALMRLILLKWNSPNLPFLYSQLVYAFNNPDRVFGSSARLGNLVPFKEITNAMGHLSLSNPHSLINLAGNIAVFVPFGIFISILFHHKGASFWRVLISSLALSLSFEVAQLVLYIGTFDVDDLILNTTGGLIGYGVVRLITWVGGSGKGSRDRGRDKGTGSLSHS